MGKNYAESSLKRFLKKRVRITLGLVVTFLITGMAVFAEGTAEKPVEEMNDFEKAEYYLDGLNSNDNKLSNLLKDFTDVDNGKTEAEKRGIKLDKENNKIILENFKNGKANIEITLKNENISNKTAENIQSALNNGAENIENISNKFIKNGINNGILLDTDNSGIAMEANSVNNGIVSSTYGQKVATNQTAVNNGIIAYSNSGQYINGAGNAAEGNFSILYNNGIIYDYTKGNAQAIQNGSNKSAAINNGILINGGQLIRGGVSNYLYNYGVIENSNQVIKNYYTGVYKYNTKKSYAYNYGIIKSGEKTGQIITVENQGTTSNSFLKNYGIIEGNGQKIEAGIGNTENTAENYGTIISTKDWAINVAENNSGTNYGTVIIDTDNVFSDNTVTNKGIVILNNHEKGTADDSIKAGINKGIIIDKNGAVVNEKEVAEYKNGKQEITDTFTDSKTTAYVTGTENKITENLSDKVIGTIVTDDISEKGAVFNADKDLVLENTVITGYFENNGTLLDMGDNDLTLLGDTKLAASRDDFDSDVTALNIDGTLKRFGEAEVAGKITGNGKIADVAVNGTTQQGAIKIKEIVLQNAVTDEEINYLVGNTKEEKEANNYTEIHYGKLETEKITLDFDKTAVDDEGKTKGNTITFIDELLISGKDGVAVDGRGTTEKGNDIDIHFQTSLDNEKVKGDILLGASDDTITVDRNGKFDSVIDMGAGNDSFTVNGFADNITKADNHKELGTFNYKLVGVETITLKGTGEENQGWHIGEQASLSGTDGTTLTVDNTELHVEMNNDYGKGDVTTSLDKLAGENGANNLVIETSKDDEGRDTGVVKFTVGDKFNVSEKQFDVATDYDIENANISSAVIFKAEKINDKDVKITVKEADEYNGKLDNYKGIYDAMLGALSENEELRNAVNYSDESKLVGMISEVNNTAEAFYTTGYAVTKDVTDTYMSVVEDFGRKAGAGEWIAYGKYVNSDTEFDGGKASKGYDGDITGTVGMIEYGVNDTTSYGAVLGKGDTEVDINDGGELSGDNYYGGVYFKHRTAEGVDILGSFGYVKNDLESKLKNSFEVPEIGTSDALVDGTADSKAVSAVLKAKKDYYVAEGLKVQPVIGAALTLITQEEAENKKMGLTISQQDIDVYELITGVNIIKELTLETGKLEIGAGVEYSWANSNQDRDAKYMLNGRELTLEDSEIASSRGKVQIGAEYIHENGIGVDTKYEMLWSDKGDDSRITAGVSYRF